MSSCSSDGRKYRQAELSKDRKAARRAKSKEEWRELAKICTDNERLLAVYRVIWAMKTEKTQ